MTDRGDALRRVAAWLDEEVASLAAEALRRMQDREPTIVAAVAGRRSRATADVAEALRALADAMRRENAVGDHGSGGAVRFAAAAAAAGVAWTTFADAWSGYRAAVADAVALQLASPEWQDAGGPAGQRAVMRFLLAYEDAVGKAIVTAFLDGREREGRDDRDDLTAQIEDLLGGQEVSAESLPFELGGHHLAVVAWGDHDRDAVEELRRFLGLTVTVEQRRQTVRAWFHGSFEELTTATAAARGFTTTLDAQLAFGEPEEGAEGFATSHLQACGAERVGMLSGAPLTLFVDVGLEAFALDDERLAREFVARELGPLAEDDVRAATLRQTLSAYFGSGNSASAAAATLGLHERTVSYRIRAAEQRLGRYVIDCQDNLALALRLHELFAAAEDASAARSG